MTTQKSGTQPTRSTRVRSATIIARQRRTEKRRWVLVQLGIALVVVVAVLGTTVVALRSTDAGAAAAPASMTAAGGVVLGSRTAPVRVTVVEDFGCPHCRVFESEAGPLLASYAAGTEVSVEYRGIAFLDRAFTSDYSSRALNASACMAATATTAAWTRFHAALFEHQPAEGSGGLDDRALISLAATAGGPDGVADCITQDTYGDWVEAQTAATLGHNGVEGTPTVFVNDVLVEQPSSATVAAAVETALGR